MANQLFAMADGPALIEFDDGSKLQVGFSEELVSVTVSLADEAALAEDWPHPIEARDPALSESRFRRLVGKRVAAIRVLQSVLDPGERRKIVDRPREIALLLELEDALLVGFSNGLVDAPNNFAVITEIELARTTVPYVELLERRA